jgi:hypothetical protein
MSRLGLPADHPHTLVPLTNAVMLIHRSISKEDAAGASMDERLDFIASAIAEMVPIYEYSCDPAIGPRQLLDGELSEGRFNGGGRELRFADGSAPLRFLGIAARDIPGVVAFLLAAAG